MIDFQPGDIAIVRPEEACRYGGHTWFILDTCRADLPVGAEYVVLSVEDVDPQIREFDPTIHDAMRIAGKQGLYCCGCFDKKAPPPLEPIKTREKVTA